ncbi:MAG: hypothetical protein QM820_18880 [Minicystis sp.]
MKRHLVLSLSVPLIVAAGCSESIPALSNSTSSSASSSTSASSSASSGSGGSGGSITFSSSSSGNGGAFHGTGGTSGCTDPFIDVVGDGPAQHFTALCADTYVLGNPPGPVAYHPVGGGFIESLIITGCASTDAASPKLSLDVSAPSVPGTDTHATATYRNASQMTYSAAGANAVSVTITVYEDVGGIVEGSYSAVFADDAPFPDKSLSGTFRVCHEYDFPKP